jgi:hypothetical protein
VGTLRLEVCKFLIISLSVFLRMSNILHNVSTEYQNTSCMFKYFAEIPVIYKIMWKNMAQRDKPQIAI